MKNYSFSEGFRKDGMFDLDRLKKDDDMTYLRLLGILFNYVSKPHGLTLLPTVDNVEILGYMQSNLTSADIKVYDRPQPRRGVKGYTRPQVIVRNPALIYPYRTLDNKRFYTKEQRDKEANKKNMYMLEEPLGPKRNAALMSGVLTVAVGNTMYRRTTSGKLSESIMHLTSDPRILKEVRLACSIDPIIPWDDYPGERLGTLFFDPLSLEKYMLFDSHRERLEELPYWDANQVRLKRGSMMRSTLYTEAKNAGKMGVTRYRELKKRQDKFHTEQRVCLHETDRLENELQKCIDDYQKLLEEHDSRMKGIENWESRESMIAEKQKIKNEMSKQSLEIQTRLKRVYAEKERIETKVAELETEMDGRPPPKKKTYHIDSYGRRQFEWAKARELAGEL